MVFNAFKHLLIFCPIEEQTLSKLSVAQENLAKAILEWNVGLQGLRHLGMLAIGQAAVPYIGADGSKLLYSSMRTLNSMDRKGDHATAARIAGVEGSDAIFDVLLKNGDVSEASHRFHSLSRGQLDSIGTIDNQIIDSFSRNLRTSNSLTTARRSQQTEYKNQFGGI